jgi:hypothetical protein
VTLFFTGRFGHRTIPVPATLLGCNEGETDSLSAMRDDVFVRGQLVGAAIGGVVLGAVLGVVSGILAGGNSGLIVGVGVAVLATLCLYLAAKGASGD